MAEGKSGQKSYHAFDLMRIIAACMVTAIHVYRPENAAVSFMFNNTLARIAVPFYFAAAGYFFGRDRNYQKLLSYLKRVFILYLMWTIIYLPIVLSLDQAIAGEAVLNTILRYFGSFFYFGVSGHLWYYPALLFSTILIWLLQRKMNSGSILIFSSGFYLFALLAEPYYKAIPDGFLKSIVDGYLSIFPNVRNGLFFGFLFMALGIWIKEKKQLSLRVSTLGTVLSLGGLFLESYLIEHYETFQDRNIYVMLVPLTYFMIQLLSGIRLPDRKIYLELRRASVVIYGAHVALHYYLVRPLALFQPYPLLGYFATLILSTLVYFAISRLARVKPFRFLSYLY